MIYKFLHIKNLSFSDSFKRGLFKINSSPKFDKIMIFFWLLGPLFYLIERDPADLWLTSISLTFLYRSYIQSDWEWSKQLWFKFAIALWFSTLISSIFSPDPLYSITQGIPWIRFPLYAAAAQFWLGKDRDIRVMMFAVIMVGMIILSFILFFEVLLEPKYRLTWPYGDAIPGVYLAKLGLLVMCSLFLINLNSFNFLITLFLIISFTFLILTGERTHLILVFCALLMCGFQSKLNKTNTLFLILTIIFSFILLYCVKPITFERIFVKSYHIITYPFKSEKIENIIKYDLKDLKSLEEKQAYMSYVMNKKEYEDYKQNNMKNETYKKIMDEIHYIKKIGPNISSYWGAWRGGIQQGLVTPFLGIGPSGTRHSCKNLNENEFKWLPGKNYCGNHPHNFYIQLFAEIGILGLFFGTLMFFNIILTCYKNRKNNTICPMNSIAYIIPLAIFFPIQQFGSFFGQWGNLFIWFSIGFALSQIQIKYNKNRLRNE